MPPPKKKPRRNPLSTVGGVVILVIAGWYAVGALCWLGIDPVTPVAGTKERGEDLDEFPVPRIPAPET